MLRKILGSVRQYKAPTFQTIFFAGIEALFEIAIPFWMSILIDRGIEAGDLGQVLLYSGLLLLFACLQCASGVAAAYRGAYASAGFAANLRADMFARVQTFSFANIDRFSTSSIVTRLTTDITYVRNAYNMMIRMAVRQPMLMIFAIIAAYNVDREVSMIFFWVLPVLAVAMGVTIFVAYPLFSKIFTNYDELNNVVQEDVRGIRVVKSFNQEATETAKFDRVPPHLHPGRMCGGPGRTDHADLYVHRHDADQLVRRPGGHPKRQRSGPWAHDRGADSALYLCDADPHEHDDGLLRFCDDPHLGGAGTPHRRDPQ